MKKMYCILIVSFLLISALNAQKLNEKYFTEIAARELKGLTPFTLKNGKIADIYTDKQIIEVEFAFKWYESLGQALFYGLVTSKKPCIICICKTAKDFKEFDYLLMVCQSYKIDLYQMEYYSRRLKPFLIY